ncbi:MAG: hypothetical protein QOD81_1548 [Solirubrobacteraceae bacterium]|jgi:hypothetical protein|nr:hypothetical protein [Solirubrobacteraceae bacterium]
MRLVLAVLALALTSAGTALAQSEDLRAPDQRVGPAAKPAVPTDLRAPDQQVGATARPAVTTDLRAPDQQVGPAAKPAVPTDLRAPDQQAPLQTPSAPIAAPPSDGGPQPTVLVVIGLGAALALCAGGFMLTRRRRTTIADDLVVE